MTTVNEMLDELRRLLDAGAISYNSATAANDVYEGYLFSLVVATARGCNGDVHFENVRGTPVQDLIFRTTPGRLHSTAHDYAHAVINFGMNSPALEVHIGVLVQGRSGVEHECDVLVLEADEARICRQVRASPRTNRCVLAIECKYYLARLPLGVARNFAGLKVDLGPMRAIFAANANSNSVKKYLSYRKLTQEFGALPGSRETDYLRSHIREAFKAYVSRHDPAFAI